jgi:integrin beta 3
MLVFHDGSTWCARRDTAEEPPHGDWAPVAVAGADGVSGEPRGLFDPQEKYRKLDHVSHDGSTWIARRDDPGELPGEGWFLAARAGSKGRSGDPGSKGDRGPPGNPGASIMAARIEGYRLVLTTSDGKALDCDLTPMLQRFRDEAMP